MSNYYDDISHAIYGKPMRYEDLSDEELAKTTKTLKTVWELRGVIGVIGQPKPRFDKIAPLLEYIETILQRRMECDIEDEIMENYNDIEEDNNEVDTLPDIILPPLPIPHSFSPPLDQPPPLLNCSPVTIATTMDNHLYDRHPPNIIAPQPFPPSPNILFQQPQPHLHTPPKPNIPPDLFPPQPLPLKPNIPVDQLPPVHSF
jgi:hypothetical protein